MNEMEIKLMDYIRKECLPDNSSYPLRADENLFDSGIVDSAGLISFIAFIESEYNIVIPDEDLLPENFISVRVIACYLASRLVKEECGVENETAH
ncbi:MAG: acyl carrier protein [Ignavibacteriaceae bacterium]|nr:acyl carrier protein [Ignavibacteriaceae bacterium]